MLSQEEINALLAGASGSGDSSTTDSSADNNAQNAAGQEDNNNTPSAQNEQQFVLSDSEKDAVGEISNISMGTAATTLSSLQLRYLHGMNCLLNMTDHVLCCRFHIKKE